MGTIIWWIRRDLRLCDNPVLLEALKSGGQVVPVFILDPKLLLSKQVGKPRLSFLFEGLRVLDYELRSRGSYLVLRSGDPLQELARLQQEAAAEFIFAEPDYSPFAFRRDQNVSERLPLRWIGSPAVLPPGSVLKSDGRPYIVFTPFRKAWLSILHPHIKTHEAPERIVTPPGLQAVAFPIALSPPTLFPPGEHEARRRLEHFVGLMEEGSGLYDHKLYHYAIHRDHFANDGTSAISPYLRFGMASARSAVALVQQALRGELSDEMRNGALVWLNQLIWRDFYIHILHHFPAVLSSNFRHREVRWDNDPAALSAWQEGRTGYPVVDAAQRQLLKEGWIHNRLRMISASFLTKDLLVDWRLGEEWFMRQLIDGDPALNNGGWQWIAGTGLDAAPYFRIFNPITQSLKFDPGGSYIRRWLPELTQVPEAWIHQPWKMPLDLQRSCGVVIGRDYPHPIVDHDFARKRLLDAYRPLKKNAAAEI